MTAADFNALTARLSGVIDLVTLPTDIGFLIAHTTRLRASIAVILKADPAVDRRASRDHLKAMIGGTDES